jgi:arsenical pump membrane protein
VLAWAVIRPRGRTLRHHGSAPDLGEFTRLGLLTVPAGLVIAVLALWVGLRALGG